MTSVNTYVKNTSLSPRTRSGIDEYYTAITVTGMSFGALRKFEETLAEVSILNRSCLIRTCHLVLIFDVRRLKQPNEKVSESSMLWSLSTFN